MKRGERARGVLGLQGRGKDPHPAPFLLCRGRRGQPGQPNGKRLGTWNSTGSIQCPESGLQRGMGHPDALLLVKTDRSLELQEPGCPCSLCLAS